MNINDINFYIEKNTNLIQEYIENFYRTFDLNYNQNLENTHHLLPYSSTDIRQSKYKIAPVDNNLFPAGFNNFAINTNIIDTIASYFREYFQKYFYHKRNDDKNLKILLIPENITRNQYYIQNIQTLKNILNKSGAEVKIGYLEFENNNKEDLTSVLNLLNASLITEYDIISDNKFEIKLKDFIPDIILLNNDLTQDPPLILKNAIQPILPNIKKGWHQRSKYKFFQQYNNIILEICKIINLDSWFLSSINDIVEEVNFHDKIKLEKLADTAHSLISKIENKYKEHSINEKPLIFIKADNGTQGMGIMAIQDPEEIIQINKKNRNKMQKIKYGILNSKILLQEGIPSDILYDNFAAEYFIYNIGSNLLPKLVRYHDNASNKANLNSPGMKVNLSNFNISPAEKLIIDVSIISNLL